MNVAVTGASGFVGGYLVDELVRRGHRVNALVRRPMGRGLWGDGPLTARGDEATEPVAYATLDLTDPTSVEDCLSRVRPDAVVHCAAQASVRRSWESPGLTFETNAAGTANLLQALKGRVGRLVLVGSAQQYAPCPPGHRLRETDAMRADSPYALSKIAQEELGMMYGQAFGLEVVATRSFNHTGPGQSEEYAVGSFCSQIARIEAGLAGRQLRVGNLDAERDFCDVRDVVAAYAGLLESGVAGEAYNVCRGEGTVIRDVLERLLNLAGLKSFVEVVEGERRPGGDREALVGNSSKIKELLDWTPRIPLDTSLADTLGWYRGRIMARLT